MKGLRNIPRVLKINRVEGRSISLLFNNGESRVVDIRDLFNSNDGGLGDWNWMQRSSVVMRYSILLQ